MCISIIKPGLLDTIQDLGRYGYGSKGINCGGAMDRYAAQLANMLVGNPIGSAVMEIHFPGPQILCETDALISVTGADFTPSLNDEPLTLWQPMVIRKNTILHFPRLQSGARCYLAIQGGFKVPAWLGSYSTNLKAGAGGFRGRKLEKGDELFSGEVGLNFPGSICKDRDMRCFNWRADISDVYDSPNEIRFLEGHEFSMLADKAVKDFLEEEYLIHPFSDRMGYRLVGPILQCGRAEEQVSSGVSFGTIQLLTEGELIVLMADHQTTGGYPKIGHVISADLPKLAQLRPNEAIRFRKTDMATAEALACRRNRELSILRTACLEQLNQVACKV